MRARHGRPRKGRAVKLGNESSSRGSRADYGPPASILPTFGLTKKPNSLIACVASGRQSLHACIAHRPVGRLGDDFGAVGDDAAEGVLSLRGAAARELYAARHHRAVYFGEFHWQSRCAHIVEATCYRPWDFQDGLSLENVYKDLRSGNQSPLNQL